MGLGLEFIEGDYWFDARRLARHRALARDFITSATGLYAAGQVTLESL